MAEPLCWIEDGRRRRSACRVCATTSESTTIASVTALSVVELPVVKCSECGSISLLELPQDSSPTDESVDAYVEGGAGIGSIASFLAGVDPTSVRRFLDVGCNYGFALDLGRFLYGWEVVGVEPSLAGLRGAAELELDIRNEYLTEQSEVGEPFDLVLASEVIEHVPDPVSFLTAIRSQLTPGGVVLLTTPAAEIIDPANSGADVISAISPGYHVFLASQDGLERVLARAGFQSVSVVRDHGSLFATAAVEAGHPLGRPRTTDGVERMLLPYYRERAQTASAGTALRAGMAVRALRSAVSHGDFATAEQVAPIAVAAVRERHHIDLTDPAQAAAAVADGQVVAANVAGAAFALGMMSLLHRQDHRLASDYFALAEEAVDRWERQVGVLDLDSVDLRFQAAAHAALAGASHRPDAAAAAALRLSRFDSPGTRHTTANHQCRVFVDLVARGHYPAATVLRSIVAEHARALVGSASGAERATALDTVYSLGILALVSDQADQARAWFAFCRRECLRLDADGGDEHARRLAGWSDEQIQVAIDRGAVDEPDLTQFERAGDCHHSIDVYWCDAFGIYLEGWAHAGELPIEAITVQVGALTATAPPTPTPQLVEFWPDCPAVATAGFAAFLAGRPTGEVSIVLHTAVGDRHIPVELPDRPLPSVDRSGDLGGDLMTDLDGALSDLIATAPPGPVLAIGLRAADEHTLATRRRLFGDREVVGVDIHPGLGVDIVADAHALSAAVTPGSFAVVYSASVLEHVAVPWIVARECAAVLMDDGLAVHVAPWVWPTHAEPNDFWRFSAGAPRQLFGPATGFAPVADGDEGAMRVMPENSRMAVARMPTTTSSAMTWVAARKVADRTGEIAWPYDPVAGREQAMAYPVDGLLAVAESSS